MSLLAQYRSTYFVHSGIMKQVSEKFEECFESPDDETHQIYLKSLMMFETLENCCTCDADHPWKIKTFAEFSDVTDKLGFITHTKGLDLKDKETLYVQLSLQSIDSGCENKDYIKFIHSKLNQLFNILKEQDENKLHAK